MTWSGGNVGIGTTSPVCKLDIAGGPIKTYTGSDAARIIMGPSPSGTNLDYCSLIESISSSASNYASILKFYTHGNATTGSDPTLAMTINSAQQVGIGTTSPTRALHVYGGATNVGPVVFDCAVSSGFTDVAFLVRVQQASATTYCLAMFQANGGSDTRCFIRGDGNLYNTNNSYGAISDRNLKENIVPARSYMDDLNKLQVVKFSFKAEKSPVPTQLGLIAQDVSEVFPGLVDTDNDGNKNLKYSILNMMMLKTVQELSAKNAALEQSLGSLEARLAALEGAGA